MTERIVHLCDGDATADGLSLADLPGDLRVWADALDQGPLRPVDRETFRNDRARYAAAAGWAPSEADAAAKLKAWDDNLGCADAEEVVLWFGHDLFDQLALCRIFYVWGSRDGGREALLEAGAPQLTMVSIDRHPEVPHYLGLGQLAAEQLAQLWPRRTPIAKDAIEEAIAAWIALTAPDPRGLPFLMKRVKALPFLAGAIERHLEELPDLASGLARSERQVLASVGRGASHSAAVLAEVHPIDPRYPLTDVQLRAVLATLRDAGLLTGAVSPSAAQPWTDLAITAVGRAALAGAHDVVAEHGLDRWRGGVRLHGRGPAWRWDGASRRLLLR
jgi:Domain of unknown function (DUF1835)